MRNIYYRLILLLPTLISTKMAQSVEFPEALKHLAREAGINLPSHRSRGENPALLTLSGLAQEFFCSGVGWSSSG